MNLANSTQFQSTSAFKNDIDPLSKVWIHSLIQPLNDELTNQLIIQLDSFVKHWKSHEIHTPGHYEIRYQQFIIFANSHSLSGCSIDSSFKIIKEFILNQNMEHLAKSKLPKLFFRDSNNKITWTERYQIKNLIKNQTITKQTIIFDPTVTTWEQYQKSWEVTAENSWVSKYFN